MTSRNRANEPRDYENDFDDLAQDVLWDEGGGDGGGKAAAGGEGGNSPEEWAFDQDDMSHDSEDSDFQEAFLKKMKRGKEGEQEALSVCFDFRRGPNRWPEGVELMDEKKAEELVKKAEQLANETSQQKTTSGTGTGTGTGTGGGWGDDNDWPGMGGGGSGGTSFGPSAFGAISGNVEGGTSMGPMREGGMSSYFGGATGGGMSSYFGGAQPEVDIDERTLDDPLFNEAPKEAQFETLHDHSTALLLTPGSRLKLNLEGLTSYGASKVRRRNAQKEEKRREMFHERAIAAQQAALGQLGGEASGMPDLESMERLGLGDEDLITGSAKKRGGGFFSSMYDADKDDLEDDDDKDSVIGVRWGSGVDASFYDDNRWGGDFSSMFKTYVNRYTITMDVRFDQEIPRAGISLFQTKLVHVEENPRTGKKRLKQSDGECVINSEGGVGLFGSYGDTTKTKVTKGKWKRIVISVACGEDDRKGQIRTYVDSVPCAMITHEEIVKDGRFAIDPDALYLFSSKNHAMMPGQVAIRHIRIDAQFSNPRQVLEQRARDKLISMYEEERIEEINEQRKGLSLAVLFPKPRPVWAAPALTGTFGDAFIEGTTLEASSLLSWSYTVLNHTLARSLHEMKAFLAPLSDIERGRVSDAAFVFARSGVMMRQMIKLLRHRNTSQLMTFLRKLRTQLQELDIGDMIILPALIEDSELAIIVSRTNDQRFRLVIVNTDPTRGLNYHAVNPVEGPPKLKYRTCLVLNNVPKKNALDNVFWMAVYNLALRSHPKDTERFYDILLPFLTGNPLETSLVEGEMEAERKNLGVGGSSSNNNNNEPTGVTGFDEEGATVGAWRSPQRSETAYVRCLLEALHYVLLDKGLSSLQSKLVTLGLRGQFVKMIANDMEFVHPNENGVRVCRMACSQLAYSTVKLTGKLVQELEDTEQSRTILQECKDLTTKVVKKLEACEDDSIELPALLHLSQRICELPASLINKENNPNNVDGPANTNGTTTGNDQKLTKAAERVATTTKIPALGADVVTIKVKHTLPRQNRLPFMIKVNRGGTVDELFGRLELLSMIPASKQRLIYMGKILDGTKTFESYGLTKDNQVVHLAVTKVIADSNSNNDDSKNVQRSTKPKISSSTSTDMAGEEDLEKERAYQNVQFCNMLAWNVEHNEPYAGQAASLKKYVPIDFLQLPENVTSRAEAVHVLRETDKLCTLLDNQSHCIKNEKLLIFNLIQYIVTQVVPIPKPRDVPKDDLAKFRSERAFRRRARRRKGTKSYSTDKKVADEDEGKKKDQPKEKKDLAARGGGSDDEEEEEDEDHELMHSDWNASSDEDDYNEDENHNEDSAHNNPDGLKDNQDQASSGEEDNDELDVDDDLDLQAIDPEMLERLGIPPSTPLGDVPVDILRAALGKLDIECENALKAIAENHQDMETSDQRNLDYLDDARFNPKLGHRVRIKFHGELGIWYNGTIARVNEGSNTYFVVYEDGDTEDNVPRESVRSIFAPRIYRTREERVAAKTKYFAKLKKTLNDLITTAEKAKQDQQQLVESAVTMEGDGDAGTNNDANKTNNEFGVMSGEEEEMKDSEEPDLKNGLEAEAKSTSEKCIWDSEPMEYALQVELMLTLQRLMEHFAAAAMSLQQSRAMDAVCIIIPGCIAAIADSVMRQRAVDTPSEACSHLIGKTRLGRQLGVPGFGIGVSTFAEQTETIEIHSPELCLARAATLDYFQSPSQRRYLKIFTWENTPDLRPNPSLVRYLRHICREIAGPEAGAPHFLLLDKNPKSSRILKNYPELEAYRDVVFWWKYFLNPDLTVFPNYGGRAGREVPIVDRMQAQLNWKWNAENLAYDVRSFGSRHLRCRPYPDMNHAGAPHSKEGPPKHRFPSTATPSFYLADPPVATEDDIIYRPSLPGFEEAPSGSNKNESRRNSRKRGSSSNKNEPTTTGNVGQTRTQILGQHDSELLLSYLTVPYIRVPLILTFFASDDRLHKLQSSKLRNILDSVLFEPGQYLAVKLRGVEPVMVPTPYRELLATPYGLLINELCSSPDTILRATMTLLKDALALDTGSVCDIDSEDFNTSVQIILFAARVGARIENYLSLLVRQVEDPESVVNPMHDVKLTTELVAKLKQGISAIRATLMGNFATLFLDYIQKLDDQTRREPTDEDLIRRNSRLACDLHAHKLLIIRNVPMDESVAKTLIGSFVYLTTRHTWMKSQRLEGLLLIPEFELYEILQVQRRKLVTWCGSLKQGELDRVMQFSLEVSTSTSGSLGGGSSEEKNDSNANAEGGQNEDFLGGSNRWSRISGLRSIGRYAVSATRLAGKKSASGSNTPAGGSKDNLLDDDDDHFADDGSEKKTSLENTNNNLPAVSPSRVKLIREQSFHNEVKEISDSEMFGVEMDLQIGQMTLRSRHLSALPREIANHHDMKDLFGNGTLQVSLLERAEHRTRYRLVGLQHDVDYWKTPHTQGPSVGDEWERTYDPAELFPSESWIPSIFEPVRRSFYDGPNPPAMLFLMPEFPLPEDAEVAVLLGLHQVMGGPFKLVYLFRRLRCVHVYECLSHGRQWWWSLHLATDSRFSLRELQPSYDTRVSPYPQWWRYGAGGPYPTGLQSHLSNRVQSGYFIENAQRSILIHREPGHPKNLSGGKETFVPTRLLFGLIPECLLEEYQFWMDETWNYPCQVPVDMFHESDELHQVDKNNKKSDDKSKTKEEVEEEKKKGRMHRQDQRKNGARGYRPVKILRGYPKDEEGDHIIICEMTHNGSWLDVLRRKPGAPGAETPDGVQITGGLPGSTIFVSRVSLAEYETKFEHRQSLALAVETLKLLNSKNVDDPFQKKASKALRTNGKYASMKSRERDRKREEMRKKMRAGRPGAGGKRKEGPSSTVKKALISNEHDVNPHFHSHEIEVNDVVKYMVKRSQFIDVLVLSKNDDGTFDVKGMRGSEAGIILPRVEGHDLHKTRPRGVEVGEGIWHWDGLSDSEDDDWASSSEEEEDDSFEDDKKEKEKKKKKKKKKMGDKDQEDDDDDDEEEENMNEDGTKRSGLSFQQFILLDIVLDAADGDLELCMDLLYRIAGIPGASFPDVESLAVAVNAARKDPNAFPVMMTTIEEDSSLPSLLKLKSRETSMDESKSNNKKKYENEDGDYDHGDSESEDNKNKRKSGSQQRGGDQFSEDMVLLNLMYAPRGSRLFSLAKTLSRIENLSYICAWTKQTNLKVWEDDMALRHGRSAASKYPLRGCPPIDLVELPRLKLSFTVREDYEGNLRLFSLDHADLYVCNERDASTTRMLRGIPHSLLMSNTQGELQVLVPLIAPMRPKVESQPFSTDLVLDREDHLWSAGISQRYFLYPVHVSLSFLMTRGLESAMYLMLLRFLHRDYDEVFRLADSIATDTHLGETAEIIFENFANANDDWHPDAHACRLKISLVTLDSGVSQPWDLTLQCARYAVKLPHVSAGCRISIEEELQILENEKEIVTSKKHPEYDEEVHTEYIMTLVKNRLHALKAQVALGYQGARVDVAGGDGNTAQCWVPPRGASTSWPFYLDKTVFGETYEEVVPMTTLEDWNEFKIGGPEAMVRKRSLAANASEEEGSEEVSFSVKNTISFPSVESPNGGWLVLACFHVLWKASCVKAMQAIKELAPTFPSVCFVSIQADSLDLSVISKEYNVREFPTFVLFRGGEEVEDARVVTEDRITEALVQILKQNVSENDLEKHQELLKAERRYLRECLRQGMEQIEQQLDASPQDEETRKKSNADRVKKKKKNKEEGKNGNDTDATDDENDDGEGKTEDVHSSKKKAMELELAQLDSDEESDYDDEELQWTWDVDQGGPAISVEGLGMKVSLKAEELDGVDATWEWANEYDNTNWKKLPVDQNKELELRYANGDIYKQGCLTISRGETGRKFELWDNGVQITSYMVTGFQGRFLERGRQYIRLRRKGTRLPVQGEPEVSQEQRMRDEHLRQRREMELRYKKAMAEQRRGKDHEGIRGTVGYVPNSGVHKWTLEWMHEPSRDGNGDGVGLCSENYEDFGPAPPPCLGNSKDSGSLALYANGEVYHHGKCIMKIPPRSRQTEVANEDEQSGGSGDEQDPSTERTAENVNGEGQAAELETETDKRDAPPAAAAEEEDEEEGDEEEEEDGEEHEEEGAKNKADAKNNDKKNNNKKRKSKKEMEEEKDDKVLLPVIAKAPGTLGAMAKVRLGEVFNLWGQASKVTCILDTDRNDGVLTFEIDGKPLENVVINRVFHILGGHVLYPCASMAPFDRPIQEDDAHGKKNNKSGHDDDDDDDDDKDDEGKVADKVKDGEGEGDKAEEEDEEENEERKQLLKVCQGALNIKDDELLKDLDNGMLEKLAKRVERLAKEQPADPCILLCSDKVPLIENLDETKDEKRDRRGNSERKSRDSSASEETTTDESDSSRSDSESEESEESSDENEDGEAREKSAKAKKVNSSTNKNVPIDRCIWMYQHDDLWHQYSSEVSRKLETTRRSGAKECEVTIRGERFLVRFKKVDNSSSQDVGEQSSAGSGGEKSRVRRQIVNKGVSAGWEALSIKYNPPTSLYGSSALDVLENVWSESETMDGKKCGLGFLFLYGLLQGRLRCRIAGSSFGGWGGGWGSSGWGSFGWSSWGAQSGKSDSHRFATLLAQLYSDVRLKSIPASIINVLCRNRQLCSRMPEFRDTRKMKRGHIFNGWTDEKEPRSPLNDLMSQVVPTLQALKRKRGAMQFPPPPPYPELPKPPSEYEVKEAKESIILPELSNLSCSSRTLEPVSNEEIIELANAVGLKLGGDSTNRLRIEPPLQIEDEDHFERLMEKMVEEQRLVVCQFTAVWCQPCKTLAPTILALSRRMPGIRFIKVDVDECDRLQELFEVERLPTIKFLRGGSTPEHCLASLHGAGQDLGDKLEGLIHEFCTDEEKEAIARFSGEGAEKKAREELIESNKAKTHLSTDLQDLKNLAGAPLNAIGSNYVTLGKRGGSSSSENRDSLPFNVSQHEAAGNAVAKSMLKRMNDDMKYWSSTTESKQVPNLVSLNRTMLERFFNEEDATAKEQVNKALAEIDELLKQLRELRENDSKMVEQMLPLLTAAANWIGSTTTSSQEKQPQEEAEGVSSNKLLDQNKLRYVLRRQCGMETFIWIEYLFGALLSSSAEEDILKLNPYLERGVIKTILKLVAVVLLRSNRIGHANRCIGTCIKLRARLRNVLSMSEKDRLEKSHELTLSLSQMCEGLSESLSDGRHYIDRNSLVFDPRFLLFEFTWNLLLRKKQVEIVNMFMDNLQAGTSKVKQMIMGAGKTTVVAPLLALMLADGNRLVMSVVPKALLEMSRTRMRETFATIMQKRIYTLQFDRSTIIHPSTRRGLENAVRNRGIVVATPTTIKSIMLAYVETLDKISESKQNVSDISKRALDNANAVAKNNKAQQSLEGVDDVASMKQKIRRDAAAASAGKKPQQLTLEEQAEELRKILTIYRNGSMLLDEVDLILHPLKSELNFPMGEKFDLDASQQGERWSLPTHLFDAIFFAELGKVSTFEQRGQAVDILRRLSEAIAKGYGIRALQRSPHITLLNVNFYQKEMKPIVAEWAYLWLQKHHLHGIDRSEALNYIIDGGEPRSFVGLKFEGLKSLVEKKKDGAIFKQQLQNAQQIHELTEELYEIENKMVESASKRSEQNAQLVHHITRLSKQIDEAQYPRDDSLDNNVIVWLSVAFSLSQADVRALTEQSSVHSQCAKLEESGYTIKRCEDTDETSKRTIDLFHMAQLRCLVIGGDESRVGCDEECEDGHSTLCLRCNLDWNSHSGHVCQDGRRASFPSHNAEDTFDLVSIVHGLVDTDKATRIPSSRIIVFAAHCRIGEEERMELWDMGVTVVESANDLLRVIDDIPEYDSAVNGDEDEEKKAGEEHEVEAMFGGLKKSKDKSGYNSDDEEDVLFLRETLERDRDGRKLKLVRGRKGSISEGKLILPGPPHPLERVPSAGTQKLQSLRRRLEALEFAKQELHEEEEEERTGFRETISDVRGRLQTLLQKSLGEVRAAMKKIPDYLSKKVEEEEHQDEDSSYIHPKRLGAMVAQALEMLHQQHGKVSEDDAKNIYHVLWNEEKSIERQILGSKVVANVSPQHKKLLNLTRDWLKTYLLHCLQKVNRVSFGLLNDADCQRALEEDPLMPRSRLKLAVPFVGKDVPSSSSEFAHPDITIGLTILAYRYSGLRNSDFDTIVDDITTEFAREIGPAKERKSSQRYELWVQESGGNIRGVNPVAVVPSGPGGSSSSSPISSKFLPSKLEVKTTIDESTKNDKKRLENEEKEVVQLKYLQKSNKEQMQKLFQLWKYEPLVIHHYLSHTIFPSHMRSQKVKISASGQAVGGDMLFGTRVGFSGTPSDLLPKELGRCSYEQGDDGKMLSTVLNSTITGYEYIKTAWTVKDLLKGIARAENPRYHALIDTGALITGYTNMEVAKVLLKLGLPWCDGVVFLDDDDKQQVYVRATGRVVSADQCGIPLEKRFAFYDQIHTTGMDIQHVVNARAVITLGKDMVFRDYVQGAFRMRGIGKGQTICTYIIPEVQELMKRELKAAKVPNGTYNDTLVDIVAWLVINSMRSEQVQWSMLCMQNIANVYRKNALKQLCSSDFSDNKMSLEVFHESVDFGLVGNVPDPLPFTKRLENLLSDHSEFIFTKEEEKIGQTVLQEVLQYSSSQDEISSQKLESEQEREQEQEQEKEVRAKREQQIEIEKFVDREYSRADEFPKSWPFKLLSKDPSEQRRVEGQSDDYPFFSLSEFRLRHQEPLKFPSFIYFSRNYFNPNWNGLRRVKNVVMVLDWAPSSAKVRPLTSKECSVMHPITDDQSKRSLGKAYELLSVRTGELTPEDVMQAVWAATDISLNELELTDIMTEYGTVRNSLTKDGLQRLLTSGRLRKLESGRNYLIISLAEAETVRRILHLRNQTEHDVQLIEGNDTEVALRYTPMFSMGNYFGLGENDDTDEEDPERGLDHNQKKQSTRKMMMMKKKQLEHGMVLDRSRQYLEGPIFQTAIAHTSARFLDCNMHYRSSDLNILLCSLQQNSVHARELFFTHTMGCRRRMDRKWQETSLAKIFTVNNEWENLKQRAQAVFIRESIRSKRLTAWEAFTAFDADDNGLLSPAELYGALRFLGIPNLTPGDVVDIFMVADRNGDGSIDYKEYSQFLKGDTDDDGEEYEEDEEEHSQHPQVPHAKPLVEPYGADILREVMVQRARDEMQRQEEERIRREAYNKAYDIKVFEEELEASKARAGGANPKLLEDENGVVRACEYAFTTNEKPLRMSSTGHSKFSPILALTMTENAQQSSSKVRCKVGHEVTSTWRSWYQCTTCGARHNTAYNCSHYYMCDFYLCRRCHTRLAEQAKQERNDLTKQETYFQCSAGASLTLQVPTAIVEPTHDEDLVMAPPEHVGHGSSSALVSKSTKHYTITMDIRVDKLPVSAGSLHALVKFSNVSNTKQAGRKKAKANIYLDEHGFVTNGTPVATEKEKKENQQDDNQQDNNKKKDHLIKDGTWHIVSIVVDTDHGWMKTYVDGNESCVYHGLVSESMVLQHQITIFGGAQQRDLRGGSIRRLIIHNEAMDDAKVKETAAYYRDLSTARVLWHEVIHSKEDEDKLSTVQNLRSAGFQIDVVYSEEEVYEKLGDQQKKKFDSIVTSFWKQEFEDEEGNIVIPGLTDNGVPPGITFVEKVREMNKRIPVLMNMSRPPEKPKEYIVGELIQARFKGGKKYYNGKIVKVCGYVEPPREEDDNHVEPETSEKSSSKRRRKRRPNSSSNNQHDVKILCYDIEYDDGDKEFNVKSKFIRPLSKKSAKRRSSYDVKDEHLKKLKKMKVTNFQHNEHLEELICSTSAMNPTKK